MKIWNNYHYFNMHKCPAYNCSGILEKDRTFFTCNECKRSYDKTPELEDYKEYEHLFKDDLVVAVRNLLNRIENEGEHDLEDSPEHNDLIRYFNIFCLHKKVNKQQFEISQYIGQNL